MVCVCGTKRLWLYPPGDARPAGLRIQAYLRLGTGKILLAIMYHNNVPQNPLLITEAPTLSGGGRNSTVWFLHWSTRDMLD